MLCLVRSLLVLIRVLRTWNLTRVVACTGVAVGNLHALADTKRVNHMASMPQRLAKAMATRLRLLLGPGRLRGPHGEADMGHLAERLDGGRFQLISTASIHGVLGDLGCGFANTRDLRVWLRTAFFIIYGQVEGRLHLKCTGTYGMSSLMELCMLHGVGIKGSTFSTRVRFTR